jgi:DNA helicase-2/ATP-dependent DNA helicase PcrA
MVTRARAGELPPAALAMDEAGLVDTWVEESRLLLDELRQEQQQQRLVPMPRRLSASQLVVLQSAPEELARMLARPLPARPRPEARRGTRFHAWVEEHTGVHPLIDEADLEGASDDVIADDADLAALREAFLAGPYADRVPVAVEAPFELVLGSVVVRGRIDAVFDVGDGRYEVVDWKTGTEPADPLQLAVYRLAWSRLRDIPLDAVDAAFAYVRTGRVEHYGADLPDEDGLRALISGHITSP